MWARLRPTGGECSRGVSTNHPGGQVESNTSGSVGIGVGTLAAGSGLGLLRARNTKLADAVFARSSAQRALSEITRDFGDVAKYLKTIANRGQPTFAIESRRVNHWLRTAKQPIPAFNGMSALGKGLVAAGVVAAIGGAALLLARPTGGLRDR